jgi:quinol monooxygenase YgiN
MMSSVELTVTLRVLAEKRREFTAVVRELRKLSLAEEGVLSYEVYESTEAPGTFFFQEIYRDRDALAAHQAEPYCESYVKQLPEWLQEAAAVEISERTTIDSFDIAPAG